MSFAAKVGLVAGLSLVAVSAAAEESAATATGNLQNHWLRDRQTGCRATNPAFAQADGIVWAGACTDGVANGPGTLIFLNKGQPQLTVGGIFRNGELDPGRASLTWADGSKFDGAQSGAKFDGAGVFISARNDRFDGEWKGGVLNGHAVATWASGNHYDGAWLNGKAEGSGIEIWANGDRYEGEWRNDRPNGAGKLVRAAGGTYAGQFVDGFPAGVANAPASQAAQTPAPAKAAPTTLVASATAASAVVAPAPAATDDPLPPHNQFAGAESRRLFAVDGSSIALATSEGGFARTVGTPDGANTTTTFTFVNERMGTVANAADPARVTGLFKLADTEIDIDYSDGHSEVLRSGAGGVTLALHTPDGQSSCMAWYPEGHAFSEAEKKTALAEYASRLGVTLKGAGTKASHSSACNAAPAAFAPAIVTSAVLRRVPHPQPRPISASFEQTAAPQGAASSPSQAGIFVRTSEVHLIDAPKPNIPAFAGGQFVASATASAAFAPAPAAVLLQASATLPGPASAGSATVAPMHALTASLPSPYQPDITDAGASNCLAVASDGSHWGFKNSCAYSVQFVYCLKGESELLAACKNGSIAGSAAPQSFSALVADASMKENNVDHQFRWVACGGGAGEVIPKLDGVDPPIGRCLRARTAAR
ncbi:MAG TPA: hypothetical protein VII49_07135 [Rhizomicrobium sp.]